MAETTAFKAALGRCGLTAPAQNKFCDEYVDNVSDYALFGVDDIEQMAKEMRSKTYTTPGVAADAPTVIHPMCTMIQGRRLIGLFCWAFVMSLMIDPITAGSFTGTDMIRKWSNRALFYQSCKRKAKIEKPEKPAKFQNFGKWRAFVEGLTVYMTQVRSTQILAHRMDYLLRDHDAVTAAMTAATYDNIDDEMVACINLDHYIIGDEDAQMYQVLAECTRDTDAWAYVKPYQKKPSFRKAWKALKDHAEGPEAQDLQKAEARASIKRARYTGKGNFTFQKYSAIFTEAYSELDRLGEPAHESQKHTDFLNGIQCQQLDTYKKLCRKDANCRSSFTATEQYMQSTVQQEKLEAANTRLISGVNSNNATKKRPPTADQNDSKQMSKRRYSPKEWEALGKEGRAKVIRARNQQKSAKQVAAVAAAAAEKAKEEVTVKSVAFKAEDIPENVLLAALKQLAAKNVITINSVNSQESTEPEVSATKSDAKEEAAAPKKDAGRQFGRRGAAAGKTTG